MLSTSGALLLDFDGPVCGVFAGIPAPTVAERLRQVLTSRGVAPHDLAHDDDPLSIYRVSAAYGPDAAAAVSDELVRAECAAVTVAEPTDGAQETIRATRQSGRRVAIVSNNAADAINLYLRRHDLASAIDYVAARRTADPALMKPNPHYVREALDALAVAAQSCTLVGDSVTDMDAARGAGVRAIGYANKPGKAEGLLDAGADAIITSMTALPSAIRATAVR